MVDARSARETVRRLLGLGDLAHHSPAFVRRRRLHERDGVLWERVEIGSIDGDAIPCLLLTPERPVRRTVIAVHQHNGEFALGKSEPAGLGGNPQLAYGLSLARRAPASFSPI